MPRGEGTKKIGDLFLKYQQNLKAPQSHVVANFCEVIEDLLEIKINPKEVKFSTYTKNITLTTKGALKSEILLHKDEILTHLKGRLGVKNTPQNIL